MAKHKALQRAVVAVAVMEIAFVIGWLIKAGSLPAALESLAWLGISAAGIGLGAWIRVRQDNAR